jgi:hypothetical protein
MKKPTGWLGVVVVCILAAYAAPSAAEAASPEWQIWGGKSLVGAEKIVVTTPKPILMSGSLNGGAAIRIQCEKVSPYVTPPTFRSKEEEVEWLKKHNQEVIEGPSTGKLPTGMMLSECRMVEPSLCKIPATLVAPGGTNQQLLVNGSNVDYRFGEDEGTLTSFAITGCSLEGSYSIKGAPHCQWLGVEAYGTTRTCEFTATSGSTLKFGLNAMSITGAITYELAGANAGKQWRVHL